MTDKDLWATFEKTGSITDYLSYKGIRVANATEKMSETGEQTFESKNNSDRNDSVRNTYR